MIVPSYGTSFKYYEVKSSPIKDLDRPRGFQEFEAPRFQDSRHMKVVMLSALRTGRLGSPPPPPPGNILSTHFCYMEDKSVLSSFK
jgi:hypothetical protein